MIRNIIEQHAPELLFDRSLTENEARVALDNLRQAGEYPQQTYEEYQNDYDFYEAEELPHLIKENKQLNAELVGVLEDDADYEPYGSYDAELNA